MPVDYNEILKNEVFNVLDDNQKKSYADLAQKLSGKSVSESMLIMMEFMKNMPKGRDFSKDEQRAMLDTVLNSLPPDDAAKFKNIMKLM